MIRHIEFCLEEIECEIEAQDKSGVGAAARAGLLGHVAAMRALLADWRENTPAQITTASGDKLIWIRGIDEAAIAGLASRGVTRFQTIADWTRADIVALADLGLSLERIAEQNWIEQAAILAQGQLTLHAKYIELASIAEVGAAADAITHVDAEPAMTIGAAAASDAAMATLPAIDAAALDAVVVPAPVPVADVDPMPITAGNVIKFIPARRTDEVPAKRTSRSLRIGQVAAALAIVAGLAASQLWKFPSFVGLTAAVAEQARPR